MTGPIPPQTPNSTGLTPKVSVLSVYTCLCVGATLAIVLVGWPHGWIAIAVIPLVVGVFVGRKAFRAAHEMLDDEPKA